MLDIEKYAFTVVGIKSLLLIGIDNIPNTNNFFLLLPGIYIQIGIDWNQFPAGKQSITISIVLSNSHDNYGLNWNNLDAN